MASGPPNEDYGRGMRQTRRSQRAKDAALDNATIKQLCRPSRGTTDPLFTVKSDSAATRDNIYVPPFVRMAAGKSSAQSDSGQSHSNTQTSRAGTLSEQIATRTEAQGATIKLEPAHNPPTLANELSATIAQTKQPLMHPPVEENKHGAPPDRVRDSVQPDDMSRVNKSTKSKKKKAKQEPTEPQQKRKDAPRDAPQVAPKVVEKVDIQKFMTDDPLLQPGKLHIYQWEHPIPTNFLNLPECWKVQKAHTDDLEGTRDTDSEIDDWHDFCGLDHQLIYIPLKMSIGFHFISRAKRAFRAGRSFASFEQEELAIDSQGGANAITDPFERSMALSSALPNAERLYVYEQIKVRLCHEIWLEPYPEVESRDGAGRPRGTSQFYPPIGAPEQQQPGDSTPVIRPSYNEPRPSGQQQQPQRLRTRPQLPGQSRELHQPQEPPPHMTHRAFSGLGVAYRHRLKGVGLDMDASDEEKKVTR